MFAAKCFHPSLPSRSSNTETMAVVIIIFHHCRHEDAQFHCSWWGGWIFDDTVCYIGSVNMRFPSLSQEIFHGSTACWIHMNIWWVWRVSCCIWKNKPKTPFLTVMVEQCARSLSRSWASLALIVWSMFTSEHKSCLGYAVVIHNSLATSYGSVQVQAVIPPSSSFTGQDNDFDSPYPPTAGSVSPLALMDFRHVH